MFEQILEFSYHLFFMILPGDALRSLDPALWALDVGAGLVPEHQARPLATVWYQIVILQYTSIKILFIYVKTLRAR